MTVVDEMGQLLDAAQSCDSVTPEAFIMSVSARDEFSELMAADADEPGKGCGTEEVRVWDFRPYFRNDPLVDDTPEATAIVRTWRGVPVLAFDMGGVPSTDSYTGGESRVTLSISLWDGGE